MAKFTKRCRTLVPQTGPCKAKVFSPAEREAFIWRLMFGTPPDDSDRDVFSAILGRDVSAREFDTARSMGLVE